VCNNRALFGGCGCVFVTFLIICFCVLSDVLYYIERVPTHREPVYRYVISKRIVNHSSCNIWCSCNEEVACACGGKLCQCLACVARRFTTTCQDCVFHVHDFKGSRYPSTTLREVGTRPRLWGKSVAVHDFKGSRYPSTTLREVGTRPRLSRKQVGSLNPIGLVINIKLHQGAPHDKMLLENKVYRKIYIYTVCARVHVHVCILLYIYIIYMHHIC